MRFSPLLVLAFVVLLLAAAGCTTAPQSGPLTTPAETPDQPASAVTSVTPVSAASATTTTVAKCPAGQTACADGSCRDFTSDHDACGGCGNVCPAGYVCKASGCVNPAGTQAAVTAIVTQAPPAETTPVPNDPVTTTITTSVPTTTAVATNASRNSLKWGTSIPEQVFTPTETYYPSNTTYVDCSKYPITITSITPSSGPVSGGTPIVIRGTGFKRGAFLYFDVHYGDWISPFIEPASDTEIITTSYQANNKGTVPVQLYAHLTGKITCSSPITETSKFTYT